MRQTGEGFDQRVDAFLRPQHGGGADYRRPAGKNFGTFRTPFGNRREALDIDAVIDQRQPGSLESVVLDQVLAQVGRVYYSAVNQQVGQAQQSARSARS